MLIATDPVRKKDLAGAIVRSENEDDVVYFLQKLLDWVGHSIDYVTVDFSEGLEAGLKQFFEDSQILKCCFHACQLLTRGVSKELIRLKNAKYLGQIQEWKQLRRISLQWEKESQRRILDPFRFAASREAWRIYRRLQEIFSGMDPKQLATEFKDFLTGPQIARWDDGQAFREKCIPLFPKRGITVKGRKYFTKKVYRAWRAVIRERRTTLEQRKTEFNRVRYLVLMNPVNMKPYQRRRLRRYLKQFPWLRPIRKVLVRFYYQFRVAPAKRRSLQFLQKIVSGDSHPWLRSAVQTLIDNEEKIFRFQTIFQADPTVRGVNAIKVVNEPTMRKINRLYREQNGMRTLENLEMRTSHYLDCPLIVVPSVAEI